LFTKSLKYDIIILSQKPSLKKGGLTAFRGRWCNMLDKIKGGLFGVAIGDALGGTTEFMTPEEIERKHGYLTEIIGGGIWRLEPGEVTDDTAMTLAVAEGIITNPTNPIDEIGKNFIKWRDSDPKDIGIATLMAFSKFNEMKNWFKASEAAHKALDGKSAGNGTLMRCLPVALAYSDVKKMDMLSGTQSKMTHYDNLASEACIIYNRIANRLLNNEELSAAIEAEIKDTKYNGDLTKQPDCEPDGFVVNTFKWVLHVLTIAENFEEVVQGLANAGGDTDTTAAIAGGLAGIYYGFDALPKRYVEKIIEKDRISQVAEKLAELREA
jgi:ADP-ribosyl-[dinitrogen reductase] hydrolase